MNKLDCLYFGARLRLEKAGERIRNFFVSQDGIGHVVAVILTLLIVVVLIAVFWEQLSDWVGGIMDQIFDPDKLPSAGDI